MTSRTKTPDKVAMILVGVGVVLLLITVVLLLLKFLDSGDAPSPALWITGMALVLAGSARARRAQRLARTVDGPGVPQ